MNRLAPCLMFAFVWAAGPTGLAQAPNSLALDAGP